MLHRVHSVKMKACSNIKKRSKEVFCWVFVGTVNSLEVKVIDFWVQVDDWRQSQTLCCPVEGTFEPAQSNFTRFATGMKECRAALASNSMGSLSSDVFQTDNS